MSIRFGIARHGHHLNWGHDHGWLLHSPRWIKKLIVNVWNHVACSLLGHSYLVRDKEGELPTCACCCRKVRRYKPKEVLEVWQEMDAE